MAYNHPTTQATHTDTQSHTHNEFGGLPNGDLDERSALLVMGAARAHECMNGKPTHGPAKQASFSFRRVWAFACVCDLCVCLLLLLLYMGTVSHATVYIDPMGDHVLYACHVNKGPT